MNLLNKISSVESLRLAWAKLEKFNKESHGLTGETIAEFELNKEDKNLFSLFFYHYIPYHSYDFINLYNF